MGTHYPPLATQPRNVVSLPDISEDAARPPQRLVRAGAGIFTDYGNLKNNQKESIHEPRWTSPRRRASGWIPERRHGGHAGGAVGIGRIEVGRVYR